MWILAFLLVSSIALTLQYEPGISYKYNYQLTVLLNEDSNITSRSSSIGRNVGYKISTEFLLSNVWQSSENSKEKLLKIEILKPSLYVSPIVHSSNEVNRHWSKLDNLSYPPIYIHWNDGLVKQVYIIPDDKSMINIKKGLSSLFQIHVSDGEVKELDVSGLCDVRYKVHGSTIKKIRNNCKGKLYNQYQNDQLRTSTITSSSELLINLIPQQSIIKSIAGTEEVMMNLNLWKQASIFVKTKMQMNFIEQYASHAPYKAPNVAATILLISKEAGSKLRGESLEVIPEVNACIGHCKPISALVQEYASHLLSENVGRVKSAVGFLRLLEGFRRSSKVELITLFKNADERTLTQLLDVLAAAQTDEALEVASQLIDFEGEDVAIAERYLICLSAAPFPREAALAHTMRLMKRKMKSEKLQTTILVTLASLVRNYCRNNLKNVNSPVVESVNDLLLGRLQECPDAACATSHLLALKNAALPTHIPTLLEYVKKGGAMGLVALQALQQIGVEHFGKEVGDVLQRVYHQFWPHQESAARVLAAELLLRSSPSAHTVGPLLLSLADRQSPEVNAIVLEKLRDLASRDAALRSCLKDLLRNDTFGNYHNLAQNGSSSSYTNLLQATHDANVTYRIEMEMRPTGMLKRTSIDLDLLGGGVDIPLLSLGLFVEGFGLTDDEQKASPEPHAAGMQLSVLGAHQRPYAFFHGTAELMGLVWAAAGSEPTPAFQGNLLFTDQKVSIVLQNGIPVDFVLKGAFSVDVSGTVEVSMWNKNSHATVKNSGALILNGFCRVDTSFVESHVDFVLGGSSSLDLVVDLDFAHKPMQICLQVEQPPYSFSKIAFDVQCPGFNHHEPKPHVLAWTHNVRKTETIPGSKHMIKTVKRRSIHFQGKSFNLHAKNSQSCKELLFPKPASYW